MSLIDELLAVANGTGPNNNEPEFPTPPVKNTEPSQPAVDQTPNPPEKNNTHEWYGKEFQNQFKVPGDIQK